MLVNAINSVRPVVQETKDQLASLVTEQIRINAVIQKTSSENYRGRYSVQDICRFLKELFTKNKDQKDFINQNIGLIIDLYVKGSADVLEKYYAKHKDDPRINFLGLVNIKKQNPEKDLPEVIALAIAQEKQKSGRVEQLLRKQSLDNPQIQYSFAVQHALKIAFIDKAGLQAAKIFNQTNQDDAEVLKIREKQQKEEKEKTKLANIKRLANLEIEIKLGQVSTEALIKARLNNALRVRV